VLHSQLAEDADFVDRFEREPAMVARLRHPNIVQVYDFDVEGEQYYMVMELVGGPTLKADPRSRPNSRPAASESNPSAWPRRSNSSRLWAVPSTMPTPGIWSITT
jgi:serine/threonine protein kinase